MRNGHTQAALPAAAAACAEGTVTAEQVGLLAPVVTEQNIAAAAAQGVDVAAVEAALLGVATSRPHGDLARAVHHYLERLDTTARNPTLPSNAG